MLFLILPICFLPFLEHLKFNSYLVVGVISYVIVLTVYTFFKKASQGTLMPVVALNPSWDLLRAVPMNTSAFSAHYNFMNIYRELRDRRKNGKKAVYATLPILLVLFLMVGLSGYLSFGENTQSDILKNLKDEGSTAAYVANALMILLMICHYPFMVYGARKSLEALLVGTDRFEQFEKRKRNGISAAIVVGIIVPCTVIAMVLKSIDNIIDFTGSLAGGTLIFTFPGIFKLKVSI